MEVSPVNVKLFEPRMWSVCDLACLKWSAIMFGALVGAYFSTFVLTYAWFFVLAFLVLAIRPVMMFIGPEHRQGGHPTPTTGASL